MQKDFITSHVLDTTLGLPAAKVAVTLAMNIDGQWQRLAKAQTDADGRISQWGEKLEIKAGVYKVTFDLDSYFGDKSFYPVADIVFRLQDDRHHHIPLLISPFGYSTYRGS